MVLLYRVKCFPVWDRFPQFFAAKIPPLPPLNKGDRGDFLKVSDAYRNCFTRKIPVGDLA
jgi:hypothetical protein